MAASDGDPVIDVDGLVKRYGRVTAVDGLSMTAARGRVTALLGPNGAGKTTTVEICEGYRRADAGRIRVLGLDPAAESAALRPRLGVMLQSGVGYPGARVREMLRLVAAFAAHPLDPDPLLERLGLAGSAGVTLRRLSGGQRQRLSLAMAVIGRPEVVVLDEPAAGLDPAARLESWRLVEELRADGVTVLLTTHDMDEATRLADQVVIIDRGRVVASGSPAALTAVAGAGLRFRARPGLDLDGLRVALGSTGPAGLTVSEGPPGSYRVSGPVDPPVVAAVTGWCASRGVLVEDLAVGSRTLEDVFLDLTGHVLRP